jgi:hypothetical protein
MNRFINSSMLNYLNLIYIEYVKTNFFIELSAFKRQTKRFK